MTLPNSSRRHFLKLTGLTLAGLPLAVSGCASALTGSRKEPSYLVYVGTYAAADADSLFLYRLNPETGALTRVGASKAGPNPTYLTLDPQQRLLYTANETEEYNGMKSGSVRAFAVDRKTGGLTLLNEQSSFGPGPCYVSLDHTRRVALVANYGGGSVCALPVQANGQLGAPSATQQHTGSGPHKNQNVPHAHCFLPDPANRFALAVDLGIDQVVAYPLEPGTGKFLNTPTTAFTTAPGAGPRHLIFHPNKRWAYLINELNSTVTALSYDASQGKFSELHTLPTLPADFTAWNACADIHVSPNGRFLYASNRGHNSIVVYAIDPGSGKLTWVQHADTQGKIPRNFALDPSGRVALVANQQTNNIVTYRIDAQTGQLTPTGVSVEVSAPVCLQVVPDFLA
ncbi:lactonase family protein [Hymenobacter guriensis]|uniref:Lactonase family protein n=1 Tax=Hymenobacter guriensis TaxID=2793065 RepID=A0ABS0L1T5_9BACT|nr:lactonase family protein [Hymenobacter guriensis]MBG8554078.1 lactonase family protein [Hymenobacter guriensis]